VPLEQLSDLLFAAGGAGADMNQIVTITLPDGQTIRLNPSSSTIVTQVYNGHSITFTLKANPNTNTPAVLELTIDGNPVSSFLPILAQRVVSSATGQGSGATFAFDSVIGGVITLPGGEVLLVHSELGERDPVTGSNGSGDGYAFGAGDAVVSIKNGTIVVVVGSGVVGDTSPSTTTLSLLSTGAGDEGVLSATNGRTEVLRVPSSTSLSTSTSTTAAAGRETSTTASIKSSAGRKIKIGYETSVSLAQRVGIIVLYWII
jgi:hypothetical protein